MAADDIPRADEGPAVVADVDRYLFDLPFTFGLREAIAITIVAALLVALV